MKYAVTSTGNTLEAGIDRRFGRCAFIVTYDTDSKALEFFPNPFRNEEEGAGQALVALLNEKGVQKIVSGSFGIRIKDLMDSRKMQMIIPRDGDHTVSSVIDLITKR
jgi:predicted Fe-Mo cluster-binding NifX family protein